MRINKKIIWTKLNKLALNSVIGFFLGLSLSCSVTAQNLTRSSHNGTRIPISPLLFFADELIYDHDTNTISVQGNVQIEYDGNKIIAQKVVYNKKTGRITAWGNVEITQKDGNKIYSNRIDMTKDFSEGFINFLRVEAANDTHFSALSAEHHRDKIITFDNATYTACEPCYYKPDREVLWQIKAKKIIWNGVIKKIRFEDSHLDFFGVPVVRLPVFELPDPTVKRASGLLVPRFFYSSHLGAGVKSSYFWSLSPHYDFTLSATVYTKQGILTEGEWRQRFKTGSYNVSFAHIYQINPNEFDDDTVDSQNTNRYMVATKGDFRINPRWIYGWDIVAQSDQHFNRTYKLGNYANPTQLSQLYLSGLADKNYFDMRFYHFITQDLALKDPLNKHYSRRVWALPRVDYFFAPAMPIYAGELSFHSNMRSIYRPHTDWQSSSLGTTNLSGIAGNSFRLTGELEWKRRLNIQNGLILSPILALRTDVIITNTRRDYTSDSVNNPAANFNIASSAIRNTATAGMELRYPLLITTGTSTHILEPTAQIFIRNNERYAEQLPNEDAQNFIFDATTLFQRDKFSGYDRVEGGVRANIGLRYSGNFGHHLSLYGLAGQSFHLAGKNSFAEKGLITVGVNSGLETASSDYVAMLGASHDSGFYVESRGRFDKKTGKIHRAELEASKKWSNLWAAVQYAYIPSQSNYEYTQNRQEISFQTGIKFSDNWSMNNNVSYDLESATFVKRGISINYTDECLGVTFSYQQIINPEKNAPLQNFNFSLSLRTIADIGQKIKEDL
ncbi:LPS-assembly protein LptD [Bartonella australis]|nr:LPS-assembly protein LptD [Bartonella australis]